MQPAVDCVSKAGLDPFLYETDNRVAGICYPEVKRTAECLERAAIAMKAMAKGGKEILFVATKKQAREIVQKAAESAGMPFVTERWLGGMMTNFMTIRKSVKKMNSIERMLAELEQAAP